MNPIKDSLKIIIRFLGFYISDNCTWLWNPCRDKRERITWLEETENIDWYELAH